MATSINTFRGRAAIDEPKGGQPFRQIVHSCSACPSRPATIFSGLEQARLRELDRFRKSVTLPAGAFIFMEGEDAGAVYGLCAGKVKLSSTSLDGRTAILGIASTGDVLGIGALLSGRPHEVTAEALEQTRLCRILKVDFLNFLKCNSDLALKLAERLGHELSQAFRHVRTNLLKQSCDRLIELLKNLCESHGEPTPVGIRLNIKLCQDELAALAGVSRRSLNRGLARLRKLEILDSRRGLLVVRDIAALRSPLQ